MTVKAKNARVSYTKEDHVTWSKLYDRQNKLVSKIACKEYTKGFKKLALDPKRVPTMGATSKRIRKMSGWKLTSAQNKNLSMKEWFPPMGKRLFPVTNYIRKPESIDFTSLPDLFHEYFGHLSFLTDKKFADIAYQFGVLCENANHRQLVQISRIWAHSIEFGLMKEKNGIKLLGAGLLSSFGEAQHAQAIIQKKKKGKLVPFELTEVITTVGDPRKYHQKYFVLENVQQIGDMLSEYAKRESLSV